MDGRELEMELVVSDDGSHTIRIPSERMIEGPWQVFHFCGGGAGYGGGYYR